MRTMILALPLLIMIAVPAFGSEDETDNGPGVLHRIVAYVPNRLLDVVDIVRSRLRVGPGVALGIRATEAADLFVGNYTTLYAGLPGPRNRRIPRLPVGIESRTGVEVSAADVSTGFGAGPDYSSTEFGFGLQAALIGLDVGMDPVELLDLITGLFFVDLREDDL